MKFLESLGQLADLGYLVLWLRTLRLPVGTRGKQEKGSYGWKLMVFHL